MAHLLGYARVSTTDQDAALQLDALAAAGCYRVFTDTMSGSLERRPELDKLLDRLPPDRPPLTSPAGFAPYRPSFLSGEKSVDLLIYS